MCRSGGCGDRHFQEYKLPIVSSRGAHARQKTTGSPERLYVENRSVRVRCCAASSYGGNEAGGGEGATTPMKTRPMATQQMCIKCVGARAAGLGIFGHSGLTCFSSQSVPTHRVPGCLPCLPLLACRLGAYLCLVARARPRKDVLGVARFVRQVFGMLSTQVPGENGMAAAMKCTWRREMSKCTE